MFKRSLLVAPALACLVPHASLVRGQSAPAQQGLEARLNQEVPDYTLSASDFLQALTRIAAEFRLPMGVALTGSPESEHGVKISWHQVRVREGLQQLVQSYPGHELDLKGDVIHIYAAQTPSDGHDFLNMTIPTFEANSNLVSDQNRLREMVNHLVVRDSHARFSKRVDRGSGAYRKFRADNATVRDILDKFLMASDEYKIWLVIYPASPSSMRTGFRRTLSPFDFKPVPDDEQPAWAIFLWGYDPVAHVFNFDWLRTPVITRGGGEGR